MAEVFAGFGLTAAILAVINKTVETVQYIKTVKNTFKEQDKLQGEIETIIPIVDSLLRKARKAERERSQFPDGTNQLISKMRQALDSIDSKIEPRRRSKRLPMVLAWPFTKKDCAEILAELERLKSSMQLILQQEVLKTVQDIKSDTSKIPEIQSKTDNIKEGVTELKTKARDSAQEAIVAWLSPCNFFAVQRDMANGRIDGSGQWFLESPAFQTWLSSPGQTLWCSGMPGMGKTILSSVVVDHLKQEFDQETQVGVACVYCKWNESRNHTTVNLLAAIWMQLAYDSTISDDVRTLHKDCKAKGVRPDISEVATVLKSQAQGLTRIFVVVDALDECSNFARDFLQEVQKIIPGLSLFVTSRNRPDKSEGLPSLVSVGLEASQEEIRAYVDCRVNSERQIQALIAGDVSLGQTIVEGVSSKTKGMFLLAKLHMDALSFEDNLRDLRRAVDSLPSSLNETYDDLWSRISSQPEKRLTRAKQIIAWVAYAARPLSVRELQCAIAIEPGDEQVEADSLPDLEQALANCVGIVHIDLGMQAVRFVHETFQAYFMSSLATPHFSDSPKAIALTCITCLSFRVMSEGRCPGDEELSQRLLDNPLLSYSARFWGVHARDEVGNDEAVCQAIVRLLEPPARIKAVLQAMLASETPYTDYSKTFPERVPALWLAIRAGLHNIPEQLLTYGSIDEKASDGTTALSMAARYGPLETVRLLLDKKASVLVLDKWGMTPLQYACRSRQAEMIPVLLEAGASINQQDLYGRTALMEAVTVSSLSSVQALLHAGADTNIAGRIGWTALHSATRHNDSVLINLLLSNGAQVDRQIDIGDQGAAKHQMAVHFAAQHDLTDALSLLLLHTKDIEQRADAGRTALHFAAAAGADKAVGVLISKKADLAAEDDYGMTALQVALSSGHLTTVQLLLESGCNADVRDRLGWSPLHLAAQAGQCHIICLLLKQGVNVNAVNDQGKTPLHQAAIFGQVEAVELLLELGADPNIKSQCGSTPLRQSSILFSLPKLKPSTENPASTTLDVQSDRHLRIERVARILWHAEKAWPPALGNLNAQMSKLSIILSSANRSAAIDGATPDTPVVGEQSAYELAEELRATEASRAVLHPAEEGGGLIAVSSMISKPLTTTQSKVSAAELNYDPPVAGYPLKRLKLELGECNRNLPNGWTAGPLKRADSEDYDWRNWRASIIGPSGSPYFGGVFHLEITFLRPDYPFKPMGMKFQTPIYHPNMNSQGTICHTILSDNWSPALTVYKVLKEMEEMMVDLPYGQYYAGLNKEAATLLATDRQKFDANARDWTRKYAC